MSNLLLSRLPLAALAAAALTGPALHAQSPSTFSAPASLLSPDSSLRAGTARTPPRHAVGADSTRENTAPRARVELASVVVSGKPGSLEVVAIPLPREIAQIDAVNFDILPAPGVKLIGRTEGVLGRPGSRPSSLVVTVAAPTSALAGRLRVASAFFDALSGETALKVPIEMTVLATHRIELTLVDQLLGAKRGDVVTIRYRAVNFGNVPDSVSLGLQVPEGWNVTGGVAHVVRLGVHAAQDGAVRIWIPPQAAPGTQLVHLVATSNGAVVSAGDVRVEVENPYMLASQDGPRLELSSVMSSLQQGPTSLAYVASLQGKISDSVSVLASGTWPGINASHAPAGDLALLRLGVATLPPSFSLVSPSLRFGAGLTGGALSELAGNYVTGTGVSAAASVDGWTISGLEARPYQYGVTQPSGAVVGAIDEARIDRRVDSGTVFVIGTHLMDPSATRQLDAASLGAAFGTTPFGRLSSELGYRRFADGEGLGWSGEFDKQADNGSFSFRALHAPGGARAFARATDEIASSGSHRILDWMGLAGGIWHTSDASSTLGASSGTGWNAGPTFLLRDLGASISMQARGSSLNVIGETGGFGNRETGLATDAEMHHGPAFATSTVTFGTISRTVGTADGTSLGEDGTNLDARAAIGASGSAGSVQMYGGIQRYNGTAGMMPRQSMIGARAERVAVPIADRWHVYVGGEVQQYSFSVGGNPALSQRYNLTVPVGSWFEISAVAERNPFYTIGSNGRVGWLTAVKIDRATVLPRLVAPGETHTIYRDQNGNGHRDRGEEGLAGIVVNCGDRTVVTDSRGRFKCGSTEPFSIDARSIPAGMIAPSVTGAAHAPSDVGLTAMTAVHVGVELVGVDTLRVPRSEFSKLVVVARDSSNQPWLARDLGSGNLVFDALPPGEFVLDVDVSGIDEPLTVVDRVTFHVGGTEAPSVRLRLRGRSMKVRVLPPTQSDGPSVEKNAPRAAQSTGSRQSSRENP